MPGLKRDKARKNTAVEIVKQQGGVACVVPVQAWQPALGLVAQQGPQLRR